MGLSLKLLGEFALHDENGAALSLPTRKTRALLGYLAANADRPQSRERLMALLWSSFGEKQARHNLNQTLLSLRKLGLPLDSAGESVTLQGDAIDIDLVQFRDSRDADPTVAAALYGGPFLDGLSVPDPAFEDWLAATRGELHMQACAALDRAADAAAGSGETDRAIEFARRLVGIDPLREDAHRSLMLLLHEYGDRAGALRQYQACGEILQKELQVEPDAATKAVFEKIRREPSSSSISNTVSSRSGTPQPPLPDKPSIAVLPFANLSADREQEFFADGMTEDIITGLSRFPSLFVIARNSTFSYKGQAIAVARIANELGVRYMLEGSVRKVGERIRISAQLIDAETSNHLWAQRYDRNLPDIFAIQDEVTDAIVSAIAPQISHAERNRALRRPTASLDAWGFYQRGLAAFYLSTPENLRSAFELFDKAAELDPTFAHAFAMAAETRARLSRQDPNVEKEELVTQALERSRKAVALEPSDPLCLAAYGQLLSFSGEHEAAISILKEAVGLNPNDATAHHWLGRALTVGGQPEEAIAQFHQALRLSPHDPYSANFYILLGVALAVLGRYEKSVQAARHATERPNPPYWVYAVLAVSLNKLGRKAEANTALKEIFRRSPDFSMEHVRRISSSYNPEFAQPWEELLREAGVPEK